MDHRTALISEAEAILLNGGFVEASIDHFGPWWRVYGKLADGNEHVGTTHLQGDPQDPRPMAHKLVSLLPKETPAAPEPAPVDAYETPEAVETEEPTFAPEDDPFGLALAPVPEAEETPGGAQDDLRTEDAATASGNEDREGADSLFQLRDGDSADGPERGDLLGTDDALDADFTEFSGALEGEDLNAPALDAPDFGEDVVAAEDERGPQFIFSDDLNTIRWAKGGRLLEIAGEREAALQEGWTLDEFRSLQNLIQRMERGEAPNDQAARDAFTTLSQRSQAISRVTSYMKQRSDELKAIPRGDRDAVMAFDPEAGWP